MQRVLNVQSLAYAKIASAKRDVLAQMSSVVMRAYTVQQKRAVSLAALRGLHVVLREERLLSVVKGSSVPLISAVSLPVLSLLLVEAVLVAMTLSVVSMAEIDVLITYAQSAL